MPAAVRAGASRSRTWQATQAWPGLIDDEPRLPRVQVVPDTHAGLVPAGGIRGGGPASSGGGGVGLSVVGVVVGSSAWGCRSSAWGCRRRQRRRRAG